MIQGWGITDRGVVRSQNQDAYYLKTEGDVALAIVCDGMGGAKAGNVASTMAVSTASGYLENLSRKILLTSPKERLARAAELANEKVYRKALWDAECRGMGTTMVAAVVHGKMAYLLNIGDSRAYRVGTGNIVKVTRDHSLVEDLVERGEITPEEARVHPQRNLITRALGSERRVEPDLYQIEFWPGEFLLLCSDGLSNPLTDHDILFETVYGGEPETCCQRLLDTALSRGAPDNVTAVLIQFQ